MSTSLYWRPSIPERNYLGKDLKFVIAPKYWGHDGSLGGDPYTFTADDVEYLSGIKDSADKEVAGEAEALIELIKKYGAVEVWLEG